MEADKFADAAMTVIKISPNLLKGNAELLTSFLTNVFALYLVSTKLLPIAHAVLKIKDSHTALKLWNKMLLIVLASRFSILVKLISLVHAAPQETFLRISSHQLAPLLRLLFKNASAKSYIIPQRRVLMRPATVPTSFLFWKTLITTSNAHALIRQVLTESLIKIVHAVHL